MKVRTKIRYAEAEQYNGEIVKGMCVEPDCRFNEQLQPHVHTMHGGQVVVLEIGDWVFPEPTVGYFYPVKPEAFKKNWEFADTVNELPAETQKVLNCLRLEVDPRIVNDITNVLKADFAAMKAEQGRSEEKL